MIEDGSRGYCYGDATLAYLIKYPHSVPTEDLKNILKYWWYPPPPPPLPPPTKRKIIIHKIENPYNIIFKFKILTPTPPPPPPPPTHTPLAHGGRVRNFARLSYQQYHQIVNKYVAISQICRGFKRLKHKEGDRDTASTILQQKPCWPKHQTDKHWA